jgi:hypothetical protein
MDTAGEEAMERLMEIAQQQQMLLNRDHNNILGLGSENIGDELTNVNHRADEVLGHRDADDVPLPEIIIGQEGGRQLHPLPANQSHRRRNTEGRNRRWYQCLRSIGRSYVALSVLMACLALITSPSGYQFTFIGTSANLGSQKTDAPYTKFDDMRSSLDGHGNLDDKIMSDDEGWEAVVSHLKEKLLSLTEQIKEVPEPHSSSWTSTLLKYASKLHDHITEQFSVLKPKYDAAYDGALKLSRQGSKYLSETTESKLTSSPATLTFSWGLMNQVANHISLTANENRDRSVVNIKASTLNWAGSVKHISLYSILTTKYNAADLSSRQIILTTGDVGDNQNITLISPPHPTIFDKVFTSTPRLVIMANLLLVVTYLLQTAVADLFLGPLTTANRVRNISAGRRRPNRILDEASRHRRAGRERLWGFLLFKLLLASVVLEPTGIDLFILTSWYAFVSFLRSLSYLAGSTTNHATQSGAPPSAGALHLLTLVLICDVVAAIGCSAIFYSSGWNMLFLLICDCIILGVDVVTHMSRYASAVIEEAHRQKVSRLEEKLLALRASRIERLGASIINQSSSDERENGSEVDDHLALEHELHRLDQVVDWCEVGHASRLSSIGTAVFSLEIFAKCISVMHLLHIWALNGAAFWLVNGVIVLHIHSTVSLIGTKIAERRNALRISREINDCFPEASDKDIRKSLAAGDVCCICLNSISFGSVKRVRCGHLFHANCLREVIERERSFSSTKCPLCRTSLVAGRQPIQDVVARRHENTGNNNANDGRETGANNRQTERAQNIIPGEQSLLRFSTEQILPSWLPIPAFAFEVVRRDTTLIAEPQQNPDSGWQRFFRRGGQVHVTNPNNDGNNQIQQPEEQQGSSFWMRLLNLMGAIPMSPEEEAVALDQLVDMFPQYDRADLLRALRASRSAEAVAESILLGIFAGVPRGGG